MRPRLHPWIAAVALVVTLTACGNGAADAPPTTAPTSAATTTTTTTTTAPTTTTIAPTTTTTSTTTTTTPTPTTTTTTTAPTTTTTTEPPLAPIAEADAETVATKVHVLAPTLPEVADIFGIASIEGSGWEGPIVIPIDDWEDLPTTVVYEYSTRGGPGADDSFVQLMAYPTIEEARAALAKLRVHPKLFGGGGQMGGFSVDSGLDDASGHYLDGDVVLESPNRATPVDLTLVLGRIDRVAVAIGMVAPPTTDSASPLSAMAQRVSYRAERFGSLLDTPRLRRWMQPPVWFALRPIDFVSLGAATWSWNGWTITPYDVVEWDTGRQWRILRYGDHVLDLLLDTASSEWVLEKFMTEGRSLSDALLALAEDSGLDVLDNAGFATAFETRSLTIAGRPAARLFAYQTDRSEGHWFSHVIAFFIDGADLVGIRVNTDFDFDAATVDAFVPAFDRFLSALPIGG